MDPIIMLFTRYTDIHYDAPWVGPGQKSGELNSNRPFLFTKSDFLSEFSLPEVARFEKSSSKLADTPQYGDRNEGPPSSPMMADGIKV